MKYLIILISILFINSCLAAPNFVKTTEKVKGEVKLITHQYPDMLMYFHFDSTMIKGGVAATLYPNKFATIDILEVDEMQRRKGVGSLLFKTACEELFAKGASRITWQVIPYQFAVTKEMLLQFYTKNGGKELYTQDGETTMYMLKDNKAS